MVELYSVLVELIIKTYRIPTEQSPHEIQDIVYTGTVDKLQPKIDISNFGKKLWKESLEKDALHIHIC